MILKYFLNLCLTFVTNNYIMYACGKNGLKGMATDANIFSPSIWHIQLFRICFCTIRKTVYHKKGDAHMKRAIAVLLALALISSAAVAFAGSIGV